MTVADRKIIKAYAEMIGNLSNDNKIALMDKLSKSINVSKTDTREKKFYESFGAFVSEKSAEEIIADIKGSRRFREKDLSF